LTLKIEEVDQVKIVVLIDHFYRFKSLYFYSITD
jgi:hypothetical protein